METNGYVIEVMIVGRRFTFHGLNLFRVDWIRSWKTLNDKREREGWRKNRTTKSILLEVNHLIIVDRIEILRYSGEFSIHNEHFQ